jgi:hypothetical protein
VDVAAEDDDCNDCADNAIDEVKPPPMSSRSYRLDHNIADSQPYGYSSDEEPSTSRNHLPGRKTADAKPGKKCVTFDSRIVDDVLSSGNDAQDCGDHDRDSCEGVSSKNKHLASHNPASTSSSSSSSSSSSYLHPKTHSSSSALINTKQLTSADLSESALLGNRTTNPSSNAIARQQISNHRALLASKAHTTPSCQTAMKNNKTSNQHHRQSYAQVPPNRLSQQKQLGGSAAAPGKTSHKNAPVSISTSFKLPNFLVRKKEGDFEPKGEFFYDPSAARERNSGKEGDKGVTVLDSSDDENGKEGESGGKMGEDGVKGKGSDSVIVLSDSD